MNEASKSGCLFTKLIFVAKRVRSNKGISTMKVLGLHWLYIKHGRGHMEDVSFSSLKIKTTAVVMSTISYCKQLLSENLNLNYNNLNIK